MTTVVHVIDASTAAGGAAPLRTLLERLHADAARQLVVALDHPAARVAAGPLGRPVDVLAAGARLARWPGLSGFAAAAIRRVIGGGAGRVILHAWGVAALAACRTVAEIRCVCTLSGLPQAADARRLPALVGPQTVLLASGQELRRQLAQRGVDPHRVVVVRPPVDFRRVTEAQSRIARPRPDAPSRGIGARAAPVVLATGPATRRDGQFAAAWAAAIARHAIPGLRLMVPFASPQRERIRRFVASSGLKDMWLDPPAAWDWPELAAASDVLVHAGDEGPCTEPLAWAMAAGTGVVASATRGVAELIADRHNGLLVRHAAPRLLAGAVLRMLEDGDLRRNVTETARGQAYEVFSVRAFVDNVARVYENLLAGSAPDDGVVDTAVVR